MARFAILLACSLLGCAKPAEPKPVVIEMKGQPDPDFVENFDPPQEDLTLKFKPQGGK